jgi:hypothetical protein
MAPEVWRRKVSERSDQYSLAMSYVELRLNRSFSHDMMEIMLEHLERTPDLDPLPPAEQEALKKALAKDPAQRFRTCREFVAALDRALGTGLGRTQMDSAAVVADTKAPSLPGTQDERTGTDPYATFTQAAEAGASAAKRPAGWRETAPQTAALPVPPKPPRRKLIATLALIVILPAVSFGTYFALKHSSNGGGEQPPGIYLPHNCKNVGPETATDTRGKTYFKRIEYDFGGGTFIPFVLIPKQRPDDPDSFYIMENKVSVALFKKFAAINEAFLKNKVDWQLGGIAAGKDTKNQNENHPVFRVCAEDAHAFARALDGYLPTIKQWDKAAGRDDPNAGEGPYQGSWKAEEDPDKTQIAVGRGEIGPLEVGRATKDISVFGCHDMAGNGREWTRELFTSSGPEREIPIKGRKPDNFTDKVYWRGRSYCEDEPLRFSELKKTDKQNSDAEGYSEVKFDISFRVVLEAAR